MYVGGLTALWTNDHDNAGILGCLRIDLEFMAAAVDTPDKAERKGPLYAPDPFISGTACAGSADRCPNRVLSAWPR
jgi:hypothetical protein